MTNGNKAVCSKEELGFNITQRSSQMILYSMQNYRQNLHNRENEDVNALIGYEIYYREITEEQSRYIKLQKQRTSQKKIVSNRDI